MNGTTSKKNNALIIFIKAPEYGNVKTRLQPQLAPEESLELYQAMVEDLAELFKDVKFCDVKWFYTPSHADEMIKNWLGDDLDYYQQHGRDLGEKMSNAMREIFDEGYEKVLLIGSDIPTLDKTTIIRGFTALDENDIVLGLANDGGYYLIGSTKFYPVLFKYIDWSTSIVFQQTINCAQKKDLEIAQLEMKYDIDTYDDLVALWEHLKRRNLEHQFFYKKKTYTILKKLFEREFSFKA